MNCTQDRPKTRLQARTRLRIDITDEEPVLKEPREKKPRPSSILVPEFRVLPQEELPLSSGNFTLSASLLRAPRLQWDANDQEELHDDYDLDEEDEKLARQEGDANTILVHAILTVSHATGR